MADEPDHLTHTAMFKLNPPPEPVRDLASAVIAAPIAYHVGDRLDEYLPETWPIEAKIAAGMAAGGLIGLFVRASVHALTR